MTSNENIKYYYFLGIGGIGMSSLAKYFKAKGKTVFGYDKTRSDIALTLEKMDINIHYQDDISLIPKMLTPENTCVVYTPAIPSKMQEYNFFIERGFPIFKRAQILGQITKKQYCIAIAGTHGKTTVTGLVAHLFKNAGRHITAFIGGISENYNSNLLLDGDDAYVVEADEFDRSFFQLTPNIACVTSIDADHLDIYKNAEGVEKGFSDFLAMAKQPEKCVVKWGLALPGKTYDIMNNKADYNALNHRIEAGVHRFDIKHPKGLIEDVRYTMVGYHNLENAMAAVSLCLEAGLSEDDIKGGLANFKGIQRRFSIIYKDEKRVYVNDFAHHPTELKVLLDAVRLHYPKKKALLVFQPHLYTRTRDFMDEFAKVISLYDALILIDLYPAREEPIEGINSDVLFNKIPLKEKKRASLETAIDQLKIMDFEVLITTGCGNIDIIKKPIKTYLEQTYKSNIFKT